MSARRRIHNYIPVVQGGGGGGPSPGGTVSWGPDFGGNDGDRFAAQVALSMPELALDGNVAAAAAISLPEVDIVYANKPLAPLARVELIQFEQSYLTYADSIDSNTNWTTTSNWTGNTTSTSANLTATSSGVGGSTSNTVNGTLVSGFVNITGFGAFGTQTVESDVVVFVERQVASAGTLPTGQAYNNQFEYSVNGSTWNTIANESATNPLGAVSLAKGTISVNAGTLTPAQIDAMQVRCVGSVTSGTGLGAQVQNRLFRAWLTFDTKVVI